MLYERKFGAVHMLEELSQEIKSIVQSMVQRGIIESEREFAERYAGTTYDIYNQMISLDPRTPFRKSNFRQFLYAVKKVDPQEYERFVQHLFADPTIKINGGNGDR